MSEKQSRSARSLEVQEDGSLAIVSMKVYRSTKLQPTQASSQSPQQLSLTAKKMLERQSESALLKFSKRMDVHDNRGTPTVPIEQQ